MAQQSDKIWLKRLQRRQMLSRRMKCHGNKERCVDTHGGKQFSKLLSKEKLKPDDAKLKKSKNIFNRLFK
jgi:hypothetical protein